jgi:diaminohydroxyphosphoribosylaminopyrimidine deaminase/5-amino-6-(5-phosphoribosylamino)uracil reductase
LVAVTAGTDPAIREALSTRGCEVLALPTEDGWPSVSALLSELSRRRLTNLLVEGGRHVLGSFLDARLIDEVHVYVAPTLVGGREALTPVGGQGAFKITEGLRMADWESERVGDDLWFHGWTQPPEE